jgi:hypothetical protein
MTTPTRAALTTEHKASIVLLMLLPVAAMPQEDEPEFTDDFPRGGMHLHAVRRQ